LMNKSFQDAISNADPSAIIIQGGGYANYGTGTFAKNEWILTDSGTKAAATNGAYSFHFYPENQYLGRWHYEKLWNRVANQDNAINFAKSQGFWRIFNSESGPYSSGFMAEEYPFLGDALIAPGEIMNGYPIVRQTQHDGVALARDAIRCVAQGAGYIYYTGSRMFSEAYPPLSSEDSGWDSHGGVDPLMTTFLTEQHILGNTLVPYGRILHSMEPWLELNLFQASDGQSVVVAWSTARTNIALVPTNTALQVLDYFENEVATNPAVVIVGTRPVYLRSSTLTTNELFSSVTNGVAYQTNDFFAPSLVFYRQPVGEDPPARMMKIRWGTGTRGRSLPSWKTTALNRPAIQARWSLNNTNWSEWTERDYAELPTSLAPGTYTPMIELVDEFGFGSTNSGLGFTISGAVSGAAVATGVTATTLNLTY
ncbi:hypothetical protein KDA23_07075, partial [Candidatus Saccharibacteria bacterium]|nr:hypothetical protein [Candidatus Saccharibacteria bacterium]